MKIDHMMNSEPDDDRIYDMKFDSIEPGKFDEFVEHTIST